MADDGLFDFVLHEREVGFPLQFFCTQRAPADRFEVPAPLATLVATAIVSVTSKRGKRVLVDKTATISASMSNVFEYVLTADDFLALLRGEYDVALRVAKDGEEIFESHHSMLVKPSAFFSTSLGEQGMFFDLEDNSELLPLI